MARLNLSPLHLRRQHLDVLFLINVFVNKIICPSTLTTVGLRVPSKITRDQSIFAAPYCAKLVPLRLKLSDVKSMFSTTMGFRQRTNFI